MNFSNWVDSGYSWTRNLPSRKNLTEQIGHLQMYAKLITIPNHQYFNYLIFGQTYSSWECNKLSVWQFVCQCLIIILPAGLYTVYNTDIINVVKYWWRKIIAVIAWKHQIFHKNYFNQLFNCFLVQNYVSIKKCFYFRKYPWLIRNMGYFWKTLGENFQNIVLKIYIVI